jgi:Questin oxidase-like
MPAPYYAPLDDALDILSHHGPALANGNFNHAPMVVETLCALGRSDAVLPWIEAYRPRLTPRPAAGKSVDWSRWPAHLGRRDSFADWGQLFAAELADAPWRAVLDRWALRLAPGYSAAAAHGAIRVGHAARGLAEAETRVRLRELADALASWAASYSTLPEAPAAALDRPASNSLSPRAAIAALAVVPPDRRPAGNITIALNRLADFPDFAAAIDLADLGGDLDDRIAELAELFARIFLANARDTRTFIVFVHAVTAVHALGNIAPHVGDAAAHALARYAWQTGCGLYAAFGGGGIADVADADVEDGDADPRGLVDRAVANGDEHAIKFAEACLARHKIAPSPAYLVAIGHALALVTRR